MSRQSDDGGPRLALYGAVAEEAASLVIRRYSTSFGLAARLLGPSVRQPVQNIYALVRVADEIVDGGADEAGLDPVVAARLLNELEQETERAMQEGYSSNLVVHAFAGTARAAGFGAELTRPFFASMRMDLSATEHDRASFETYIYGSAEVVGLMCLRVFVRDTERAYTDAELATLEIGARALGSAFQKVNFLRDLAADLTALGRSYFPGIDVATLTDAQKNALLDDIDRELGDGGRQHPAASEQFAAGGRHGAAFVRGPRTTTAGGARGIPADHARARARPCQAADRGRSLEHAGRRQGGGPMTRAVVIGGGIAGLASAALLARDGYQVTLLEKNAEFGGRAGSWEHEGFRFDTGPSWYLMPEVFDHFFRLLGTTADEQLELVQLDPGYRVFGEGYDAPLDISADAEENIELFESVERGAGAKLRRYLDEAGEIYQLAIQKFLYSTFEKLSPVFTREVIGKGRRLSSLLLTPLSRLTARTVKDRRLRQILGYPAVFLGSSPDRAPSMYSLMSHLDLVEGVLYPMGGFTRVIAAIEALAAAEGVELRSGVTVRQILVEQGAATGVELVDADGAVGFLDADVVVSTADLHHSETVLLAHESDRTFPQSYWDDRIAGPSALLLYLGVSGELPELEHHSLFFSADWKNNFDAIFGSTPHVPDDPSLYVCKPSGVDPEVAPEGSENVFVLVPLPADPALGRGGVDRGGDEAIEALADSVIAQIAAAAGIPDLADRIVVRRTVGPADFVDHLNSWKGSALGPAHTLRQSAFFRAGNVSTRVKNLYFAGSSTIPGIGLPMCLISAELVVKRLRGDVSPAPLAEPLQATR